MPMDIINALGDANIESRPIWKPMHMQPVYENCDFITRKKTERVLQKISSTKDFVCQVILRIREQIWNVLSK